MGDLGSSYGQRWRALRSGGVARGAALAGDYETALDWLQRAVDLRPSNARWIMNDNDLVPLHDHPRFRQLVARLG